MRKVLSLSSKIQQWIFTVFDLFVESAPFMEFLDHIPESRPAESYEKA